jgi:cell division protein FtsI/penicillin-binding protein 2
VSTFDPAAPSRQPERRPLRFVAFGLSTVLVFSLLTVRLGFLQVASGQIAAARAEANRTVSVSLPSPRGLIYDRQGHLLVANVATYSVKIKPSDLPYGERQAVATRLSALIGIPSAQILATVDS